MTVFQKPSDKIIFFATIALIAVCAAFVFLHKSNSPRSELLAERQDESKLKIAVTMIPVENIAQEIGGDKVDITLIVPEGQSPHTFEPTPETIRNTSGAASVFKVGIIDDWVSGIADSLSVPVFYVGSGIDLKTTEGTQDPHYWLSIKNGEIIAENITNELKKLDGENADYYAENLSAFLIKADAADKNIREILSGIKNRNIITFHDAWSYFAGDYDLKVVAVYEPSPGKDPLPQDVKALIDKAREYDIKVFFSEIQYSSAPLMALGESEGIKVVSLNPLELRGAYLESLVQNAEIIRDALR
ncbi:MAG: metal ABC transporter substrate-binding protein [Parcubacteria group bacterium]